VDNRINRALDSSVSEQSRGNIGTVQTSLRVIGLRSEYCYDFFPYGGMGIGYLFCNLVS